MFGDDNKKKKDPGTKKDKVYIDGGKNKENDAPYIDKIPDEEPEKGSEGT